MLKPRFKKLTREELKYYYFKTFLDPENQYNLSADKLFFHGAFVDELLEGEKALQKISFIERKNG